MTDRIDLLPLPEDYVDEGLWEKRYGPYSPEQMEDYARANVARAVEPLQSEIDALRTRLEDTIRDSTNKIEALREKVAEWKHVAAAQAELHDEAEARAERLAEALREWWSAHRPVGWTEDQHRARPYVNLITVADKALTEALLRDQEARND